MRRLSSSAGFLIGVIGAWVATPALAQTPVTGTLEEVLVTAQRREESLSKTPVSVAVVSADELAKAQIVSDQDLRAATPGLAIRASLSSNQLNYSMRGHSKDAFSGSRPGVLPYVNEIQIGGSGGSSAFYDLASVQVLKGPQGTLFGRSATGGAVLVTTAKPTEEFSGYVSGLGGNYGAAKVEGAVSGPIVGDALLGRVAVFYQKRDGFQKNLYDGGTEGDQKRYGIRASLTAKLGANAKNDLVIDYLHTDSESTEGVLSGLLPYTGNGPPFIPIQFLYAGTASPLATATGQGTATAFLTPAFLPPGVTPATATPAQLAAAQAAAGAAAVPFYNAYFADPRRNSGGIAAELAAQQARGPFVINTDAQNYYKAKDLVVSNATTFDLGNDLQIKNIFGYVKLDVLQAYEADGTSYLISSDVVKGQTAPDFTIVTKQTSDELQLIGKAVGGKLSYVTGLYYSDEKQAHRQFSQFFDLLLGGSSQFNHYNLLNTTIAGYGQGTYQLNDDGLSLTAGLRYTSEKVRVQYQSTDSTAVLCTIAPTVYKCDQSETFNKLSWQIGLQKQLNPNLLLYGVSRRAFKSGGYSGSQAPKIGFADVAGNGFKAEQVTDVEFGAKFQGYVGDLPARANVALFHDWVKDSQRTAYQVVSGNPAAITANVPKGKNYGLEFDGQIKTNDWLTLGGTLNFTHTEFGTDPINVNGSAGIYDQVPDSPKFSGTLFADMSIPVGGHYAVSLHGDVYNQAESFVSPQSINNVGTKIDSYTLANFRVGFEDAGAKWSITANLKNAFDKVYYVGAIPTGQIYQINIAVPGDPRTVTLEARFKF